jgi:hypothetical protein
MPESVSPQAHVLGQDWFKQFMRQLGAGPSRAY